MNFKKRLIVSTISIALVTTLFSGCGNVSKETNAEKSGNNKELVIAVAQETISTDVQQSPSNDIVAYMMYEPLIRYGVDGSTLVPGAAESFSISEDGKDITFKLPKDAVFSNGDPLNSVAVKASFERFKAICGYADFISPIEKIETPDAQTVIFKCSNQPGYMLPALARAIGGIINVEAAKKVGDEEFNKNAVTYGPMVMKEWVKGSYITLGKNEKFKTTNPSFTNKGALNIDTLKVRFISNNFTRVSELISGNVDILMDVPAESLDALKGNKNIQVFEGKSNAIQFIEMNILKKPLNDLKVRTALAIAINRDELKTALNGTIEPVYGPQAPTWIAYNSETEIQFKKDYAYNLDRAKALLAEAGYKDSNNDGIVEKDGQPLKLTLILPSGSPDLKTIGPVIQAQCKNAGIGLDLKELDWGGISQEVQSGSYDMFVNGSSWLDSHMLWYDYYSNARLKNSGIGEQLDKLLDEAKYMTDLDERTKTYGEACKLIMGYLPNISLYTPKSYMAARKNIKNITLNKDGMIYGINDVVKE